MLLKFLVFLFFLYILFRIVSFFFKIMRTVSGAKEQARNFNRQQQRGYNASYGPKSRKYKQPEDGNVNIDYIPDEDKKKRKNTGNFKGGEYVDYEEVK